MTIRDLPRGVRAVLELALPEDWREDILRDLEEAWSRRQAERGLVPARLWLWGQTMLFSLRFLPERARDAVGGSLDAAGDALWRSTDAKLALRSLVRSPLIALLAVVSLGVGVGAAVTGFTFIHGAFFTHLPFPGGDRIVMVEDYDRAARSSVGVRSGEFFRRRAELEGFQYLEAYQQRSVVLGDDGEGGRVLTALFSTPGFLRMTDVQPLRGRLPEEADIGSGTEATVVLPHSVWVSAMGSDPDAVGATVEIGGEPHRVVAVMPEGFGFPYSDDLWIPFDVRSAEGTVRMIGKLREGVGLSEARAEMGVVARPDPTQVGPGADVQHLVTGVTRPLADEQEVFVLAIPLGVLVLLLLVMATNVANLVLARNANRARELALRSALGASRQRIVGQLVAEVALMALLATALGVWLSQVGIGIVEARINFPFWVDLAVRPGTVVFAAALGLLVTMVAGMIPALRATRNASGDALRGLGSGASAVRFGRLTGSLIVLQLTVCVGFLSAATLLGQSLLSYTWDRYGLPAEETLVAQLYFGFPQEINDPESGLTDAQRSERRSAFMGEATRRRALIQEEMAALPDVRMTAAASRFPGNESEKAYVEIEGSAEPARLAEVADVGTGYFELLGAEPLMGRDFTDQERVAGGATEGTSAAGRGPAPDVALVNEPFVRERVGGASPLGIRIRVTQAGASTDAGTEAPWLTIVGVVPDLGLNPGNPENAAGVYLPLGDTNVLRIALRGDGDPGAWAPWLVEAARQVDPEIQVQWSRSLADQMREPVMIFRGLGLAFLILGALALLLSAASIHALTASNVTRRTRELGIRQALGADASSIIRVVLTRAGIQLLAGTVLGTALAAGLLGMATAMPWEVRQGNPAALVIVVAAVVISGAAALVRPLGRALSIRPADAMRVE